MKLIGFCTIFLPVAVRLGFTHDKLVAILIMLGSATTVSCYIMAKTWGTKGLFLQCHYAHYIIQCFYSHYLAVHLQKFRIDLMDSATYPCQCQTVSHTTPPGYMAKYPHQSEISDDAADNLIRIPARNTLNKPLYVKIPIGIVSGQKQLLLDLPEETALQISSFLQFPQSW